MKTKPNTKLIIGFKCTVVKAEVDADTPSFEEVTEVTAQGKTRYLFNKIS